MASYSYTAKNLKGEVIKDSIDGVSEDLAISRLKDMGYFIINITESKKEDKNTRLIEIKTGIESEEDIQVLEGLSGNEQIIVKG